MRVRSRAEDTDCYTYESDSERAGGVEYCLMDICDLEDPTHIEAEEPSTPPPSPLTAGITPAGNQPLQLETNNQQHSHAVVSSSQQIHIHKMETASSRCHAALQQNSKSPGDYLLSLLSANPFSVVITLDLPTRLTSRQHPLPPIVLRPKTSNTYVWPLTLLRLSNKECQLVACNRTIPSTAHCTGTNLLPPYQHHPLHACSHNTKCNICTTAARATSLSQMPRRAVCLIAPMLETLRLS